MALSNSTRLFTFSLFCAPSKDEHACVCVPEPYAPSPALHTDRMTAYPAPRHCCSTLRTLPFDLQPAAAATAHARRHAHAHTAATTRTHAVSNSPCAAAAAAAASLLLFLSDLAPLLVAPPAPDAPLVAPPRTLRAKTTASSTRAHTLARTASGGLRPAALAPLLLPRTQRRASTHTSCAAPQRMIVVMDVRSAARRREDRARGQAGSRNRQFSVYCESSPQTPRGRTAETLPHRSRGPAHSPCPASTRGGERQAG